MTHKELKLLSAKAMLSLLAQCGIPQVNKLKLTVFQKMALENALVALRNILDKDTKRSAAYQDIIKIRNDAWYIVADYYNEKRVIDVPTAIEDFFFFYYDELKKLKNLETQVNIISRLGIINKQSPVETREATKRMNEALSKCVYNHLTSQQTLNATA